MKNDLKKDEKVAMDEFKMDLSEMDELEPIENPDSIIGPWFFVHKV